jgi:hypothetical protein
MLVLRLLRLRSVVAVLVLSVSVAFPVAFLGGCSGSGRTAPPGPSGPSGASDAGASQGGPASRWDSGQGSEPADASAAGDAFVPTSPCETISPDPSGSAATNWATIDGCLESEGRAYLNAGIYPIRTGLVIPAGATLRGLSTPAPTLQLQPESGSDVTNFMLSLADGDPTAKTLVKNLRLDGNDAIGNLSNAATIEVGSQNATVDSTEIFNTVQAPTNYTAAAVYFICPACAGNVFSNDTLYNHYYGVIFQAALTSATPNQVTGSTIHDIRCDSVTFAGYGEAINDTVYDTGWDCNNGPIPGGGFYSLENTKGAKIVGNTIHDTCGHGLDLDRVSNLTIDHNHVYDPGNRFNGTHDYCAGDGAFLLDVSQSVITNNDIENSGRTYNSGFDSNQVMHAIAAGPFTDVGANTTIAFVLAHRPNATDIADGNTVTGNIFRSYQDPASGFLGLGFFTSRGTAYDANNGWSAGTTNYFTANVTYGSNIGSKRCGGDWFAGNSECSAGSPAPCNDDDFQHTGQFHNDSCPFY